MSHTLHFFKMNEVYTGEFLDKIGITSVDVYLELNRIGNLY